MGWLEPQGSGVTFQGHSAMPLPADRSMKGHHTSKRHLLGIWPLDFRKLSGCELKPLGDMWLEEGGKGMCSSVRSRTEAATKRFFFFQLWGLQGPPQLMDMVIATAAHFASKPNHEQNSFNYMSLNSDPLTEQKFKFENVNDKERPSVGADSLELKRICMRAKLDVNYRNWK